ncbi:MAG: ATP-binding protein [Rubrivivax sp.]|nr:ATP-binding protein [Rubrivivax sp.]
MKALASLQGRLIALVLAAVAAVWLAAAVQTWFEVRHEIDELLDSHLAQAAALLVVQSAGEIDDDGPGVDAPSLHRYAPKVAFQVFHEGRLVLRSANAPVQPMIDVMRDDGRREREKGEEKEKSQFRTVLIAGTDWRVFAAYGAERDVRVLVGEQVSSRQDIVLAVLRATVQPLAIALPLLALAVWWAVYQGVQPLRRMSRLIAERRPQAIEPLVVPGAPSELRPVVDGLNGLFERITALVETERRFTADAAHELRTPIAGIRTQAQVALAETDDAQRRHALQATLVGCDRATRLVEQLLTLSRVEAGAAPARAAIDLSALVRQQVAELAPKAIDRGQNIEVRADAAHAVQADATLLAVLVRNLVDNALRYSPPGAQVRVTVNTHAGRVRLQVQDSGPGLPPEALARLGERFFRVLGTGQDGSGLGWSIVRRIAAVHGAQVLAGRSAVLGGLDVTVDWPAG